MTLKKFECLSCRHRFEADDSQKVVCPQCGSDNVEYARFRIPGGVWKWALLVGAVVAAGAGAYWLSNREGREDVEEVLSDSVDIDADTSDTRDTIPIPVPETITELPTLTADPLEYRDGGYTFDVAVRHEPRAEYYLALLEHRGEKVVARADGKHFAHVPPSQDDEGLYDLAIFDKASGRKLNDIPVSGFQPPVEQRMTKQQLQQLIDSDDQSLYGVHKQIANDCSLQFTGLPADADRPARLADVLMKLGISWESVTVTSVGYDQDNRISSITFRVKVKN